MANKDETPNCKAMSSITSESELLERLDDTLRVSPNADVAPGIASTSKVDTLRLLNAAFRFPLDEPEESEPLPVRIGRYAIQSELGRGRFGIVYSAFDAELKRLVAIKRLRLEEISNAETRRRFAQEAETGARLDHPGIVSVLDAGRDGKYLFLVLAFCEGMNLEQWLEQQLERIAPRTAAMLVKQIGEAIHHGHTQGIVHRDLKPSNLMMVPDDDSPGGYAPKVLDFGFARLLNDDPRATASSVLVGTPRYMAPEQAEGAAAAVGPETDVFALGAILYELLTGGPPFPGNSVFEVFQKLQSCELSPMSGLTDRDRDLEIICRKCLRREPKDRYRSAMELCEDLQNYLADIPILVRTVSRAERLMRRCLWQTHRRGFKIAFALTSAVLLPIVYFAVLSLLSKEHRAKVNGSAAVAIGNRVEDASSVPELFTERDVAARVIELGGTVEIKFGGRSTEIGRLKALPDVPMQVTWIMLPRCERVSDADIQKFVKLHSLVGIDLYSTGVTDVAAEAIGKISSLHDVYVHSTSITDAGASSIIDLRRLRGVNFNWTKITDASLRRLAAKTDLRKLKVRGTAITNHGVGELVGLPFLEILDLGETSIEDAGFLPLVGSLTRVKELEIDGTRVSDRSLDAMREWRLNRLRCSLGEITESGLARFRLMHSDCSIQID